MSTPNPGMRASVGTGVGSDVWRGAGRVWTSSRQGFGHCCVLQEDTVGIRVALRSFGIFSSADFASPMNLRTKREGLLDELRRIEAGIKARVLS